MLIAISPGSLLYSDKGQPSLFLSFHLLQCDGLSLSTSLYHCKLETGGFEMSQTNLKIINLQFENLWP